MCSATIARTEIFALYALQQTSGGTTTEHIQTDKALVFNPRQASTNRIRFYNRVEVYPDQKLKLLLINAPGSVTAEQLTEAVDKVVAAASKSEDDANAQLESLKFT